nr:hypothetical protein [Xanthobacter dioxanivorans]
MYSAWAAMKETFAVVGGQPSQVTETGAPRATFGKAASGTKKRTFTRPGGSRDTTGRPSGTSSPGRK